MDTALAYPMNSPDQPISDDARLLRAFVERHDREAFAEVLHLHLDACWRVALRLSGNAADAEDVVQEAVLVAMRRARGWRGGSVRAWMLGIVANTQRRQARSATRRARREHGIVPPASEPPRDHDEDESLRAATLDALTALPETYRAPVCLRYLDGLDFPEIAQALGLGERTARTRVSRGLERLREMLAPRRAGLSAETLGAVMASAPAPLAPPHLVTSVSQTVATAPIGAAAGSSLASLIAIAATILAGLVAIGLRVADRALPPQPPLPGAAADAGDSRPEIERTLDLRIDVAFYHHGYPLLAIANRLPPGRVLPYAWPFTSDQLPWTGATVVGRGLRVRDILDQVASQLGLAWEVADGYVVFFGRMDAADRTTDLTASRAPSTDPAREAEAIRARDDAARRLAWSRDRDAFRALLLAFGDPALPERRVDAINEAYGTPWPTRRIGTLFHAFRDDHAVKANIGQLLARIDNPSPALLYYGGVLRLPEVMPRLRIEAARLFTPHGAESAARAAHRANMQMATAIAIGELGARWSDGQPAPLDPLAAALASPDTVAPVVRIACAHALARCADDRAVDGLIALWKRDGWSDAEAERLAAATVEARDACADGTRLVRTLLAMVSEADDNRCDAATLALAQLRDPQTIEPAIDLLRRKVKPAHALGILNGCRLPQALEPLKQLGASTDPDIQAFAAGARLALGDTEAVPILERMARDLPERAMGVIQHLTVVDVPEAIEALARLTASIGPRSYRTLAMTRAPQAVACLVNILRSTISTDEMRKAAKEALWVINDPAGLDAAADAPGPLGYSPHCPSWIDVLAALDRGSPLPHAVDYPRMPGRVEAARRIERALALSDRRRAQGVEAAAFMYADDPTLPRADLIARLTALMSTDQISEVRIAAVKQLALLCTSDDLVTAEALAQMITHDADNRVRNAGREALLAQQQRLLKALYAENPSHLGLVPPDESVRSAMQQAVTSPKEGELDLPKPTPPGGKPAGGDF